VHAGEEDHAQPGQTDRQTDVSQHRLMAQYRIGVGIINQIVICAGVAVWTDSRLPDVPLERTEVPKKFDMGAWLEPC